MYNVTFLVVEVEGMLNTRPVKLTRVFAMLFLVSSKGAANICTVEDYMWCPLTSGHLPSAIQRFKVTLQKPEINRNQQL